MARDFSVSVDVVLNKLSRLSRNGIATLQQLQRQVSLNEDLAADGFESFTVSQYFPCHINLLAGVQSQLVYWVDYVALRRKGRMTDVRRKRREQQRIRLQQVSSKRVRNRMNPLFSVNYLDRQLRKDMAEHVRETVCVTFRNNHSTAESCGSVTSSRPVAGNTVW